MVSEYTKEQLDAWAEARRLFPGLLATVSDQVSLIESHGELSSRVAELELQWSEAERIRGGLAAFESVQRDMGVSRGCVNPDGSITYVVSEDSQAAWNKGKTGEEIMRDVPEMLKDLKEREPDGAYPMVNETNIEEIEAKVTRLEARIEAQRIELRRARGEGKWVSEVKTDGEMIVDLRCQILSSEELRDEAVGKVAELERQSLNLKLPKVWSLEIAGREVILRYENSHMSACATLKDSDEPESFVLKRDGLERIDGWPEQSGPRN